MRLKRDLILVFSLITYFSYGQQQPPDVDVERVGNNIGIIRVSGNGNPIGASLLIYKSSEGSILVDTGFGNPQLAAYIQAQVKKKFSDGDLDLQTIFITHWHPDHSGGIQYWRNNATVIAHENVRRTLVSPQKGFGLGKIGQVLEFPARAKDDLPDETFSDSYQIMLAGNEVNALHLKGHTDGDLIVHFKSENVIHIGDLVWPGTFPFTDNHNGGNAINLLKSLKQLKDMSDAQTVFVSGHGETFDQEYLKEYIEMMKGTIKFISKQVKAGKNLEDIKSAGLKKWNDWASPLVTEEVWAEMVFKSLKE